MKKMAVKVLVPVLVLLMLVCMPLSMTSSVRACKLLPATVYITGITGYDPNIKYTVSDSMLYLLYFKFWGTILIFVDGSSTPIPVNWVDVAWGTYNIATNMGSYTFYEVWTLPSLSAHGTFVGFDHPHTVGDLLADFTGYPSITWMEGHIIVVGTGAYAGQVINVASPNLYATSFAMTGYWLMP